MRDALSTEQWEYLRSIGIQAPPEVAREAAATSPVPSSVSPAPVSTRSSKWQWLLFILVIVTAICLLFAAKVVKGGVLPTGQDGYGAASPPLLENVAMSEEQVPVDSRNEEKRLDQLKAQLSDLQDELRQMPSRSQLAKIEAEVQRLSKQISGMKGEIQATRDDFSGAINSGINSMTARLEGQIHAVEVARAESYANAARQNQRLEALTSTLQVALERQQRDARRYNLVWGGGVLVAIAWSAMLQFRRPRALGLPYSKREQATYPSLFEGDSGVPHAASLNGKRGQLELTGGEQEAPALFSEVGFAKPWTMGLASITGNIRTENQDYGLCLRAHGCEVLIIADGLGGIPLGRAASRCAVQGAAEAIQRAFRTMGRQAQPLEAIAGLAMEAAGKALKAEGDKRHIATIAEGLRTTLIVTIATAREIGFSYIGDGGGVIIGSAGETKRFVKPQKVAANLLQASLGPIVQGEHVCGTLARQEGDLVIVGTDGVFDAVEEAFTKEVIRTANENQGDLQRTAEQLLHELASFRDHLGYVCDDNMTLGLMGGRFARSSERAPAARSDNTETAGLTER